mmetsp:Transcript_8582/g.20670  ORF Transcript_8582/g.20670 Transcript_8582/m.20670 type:complete len:239 (-) Transcript_8582:68-784(-)
MTVHLPPFVSFKPSSGGGDSLPVVIVIQEWWGVNDQIKVHAQKIADLVGAEAVIPDLYKGKIGLEAEEASHLMDNLDFKNAVDEIEVLCAELQKDNADRKIGVIGFCMGGSLALATAALFKKPLAAAAPFYGIPPEALCNVGDIVAKTPIQGHFGDLDNFAGFSDKASVDALEAKLKAAPGDKPFEICRYEKEGHAFMNHDEFSMAQVKKLGFPGAFAQEDRDLAWSRLSEFLKKHLF